MNFKDPVGAHQAAGIPVKGQTWEGVTIADDMTGMLLMDCVFRDVRLENSKMNQALFIQCRFENFVIADSDVVQTRFINCEATDLQIKGGTLYDLSFSEGKYDQLTIEQKADILLLSQVTIEHLIFNGMAASQSRLTISDCEISKLSAENAAWTLATVVGVDFEGCVFTNANFERCSFIKATGQAVDLSTVLFKECNLFQSELPEAKIRKAERSIFAEADLTAVDCEGANLQGCLFAKANMPGGRFSGANLQGALLVNAMLREADFSSIQATNSVWHDADLTNASLESANLWRGSFRNAILDGASVTGADMRETDLHGVRTVLTDADTTNARGTLEWRAEVEAEARKEPDLAASS